jgi:hypothetical protein
MTVGVEKYGLKNPTIKLLKTRLKILPVLTREPYTKVAVLLDSSREFRVSTSDLIHFEREETVLAGLRL